MPYNSSSFEKQLAKYKIAQAQKAAGAAPEDPHVTRSRVASATGALKPNIVPGTQLVGDGPQTTPVQRADKTYTDDFTPIIVDARKKPFYRSGWFIFIIFSIVSTAAMPIFFKDEMNQVLDVASSVKSSTGVDPFAMTTYTNLLKGAPPQPVAPQAPVQIQPMSTLSQDQNSSAQDPLDMRAIAEQVEQNAKAVTSQGSAHSMQYIEEETRRLNEAAKQFDEQYGAPKH